MTRLVVIFLLIFSWVLRSSAAVPVIPGLERMELHITNPEADKNFGTHGYLLGGGDTHIYSSLAGMLGDEDNTGVENLSIALQAIVYGVVAGLKDDWTFLNMCGAGLVQAGYWSVETAQETITRWRSDPKARLAELKETLLNATDDLICKPLAGVAERMSTPEGYLSTLWEIARFLNPITGPGAALQSALENKAGTDLTQMAAQGMVDWMYDFHSRMVTGAEKTAWLETPLSTSNLLGSNIALARACSYGFGHTFGYLCEQVAVGALTGSATVVGKAAIKGGVNLTGKLAARTLPMATPPQLKNQFKTGSNGGCYVFSSRIESAVLMMIVSSFCASSSKRVLLRAI